MVVRVIQIARLLIILASRHRSLVFENLALRQQLAVHHRTRPKPIVRWSDAMHTRQNTPVHKTTGRNDQSLLSDVRGSEVPSLFLSVLPWACRARGRGRMPSACLFAPDRGVSWPVLDGHRDENHNVFGIDWSGRKDSKLRPLGPEPSIDAMISECFRRFLDSGSNWVAARSRSVPSFASHRRTSTAPPVALKWSGL
jgi:hypothetical protein